MTVDKHNGATGGAALEGAQSHGAAFHGAAPDRAAASHGAAPDRAAASHGAAPDRAAGSPGGDPPREFLVVLPAPEVSAPEVEAEPPTDEGSAEPVDASGESGVSGDVPFWSWAADNRAEADNQSAVFSPDDGEAGPAGAAARPASARPVVTPVELAGDQPGRSGIGQRRGNLAHLSADPRLRTWQRRVIIAIIVGAVFTVVASWRLGLTLAIIAVIGDTIYSSWRGQPGSRGVKMTKAQRQTRRQLAKLKRAGYRAIDGNLIPQSEEQIDHLVVGPAGVFAIDSEAWDKKLVVRTKNARQLWHGPFSMKERLEHARWESERAAEMLSGAVGSPVTVRPAMAVYGPRIPWDVVTIRDVDVFSGPRLRKYLRRRARQGSTRLLNAAEVERIYQAANQAFPSLNAGATAT